MLLNFIGFIFQGYQGKRVKALLNLLYQNIDCDRTAPPKVIASSVINDFLPLWGKLFE
ncbi:hypothetical protein [Cyanobacterium sp. Dongsha4]|uniref:hypothetical protein n=1 Tax=Cyanobacterium sp. DS4 TaxID=2878255 RepID=UPI002E81AD9E|nr:hypothetical protein [Cyanobacterium sp. Dongsha4]WVL00411.1 hypothetical protein Dongsha4_17465 [Cyanobacterium sp. Dongsha4]